MITIKLKYKSTSEFQDFLSNIRKQFSCVYRYSYNRFYDGLTKKEIYTISDDFLIINKEKIEELKKHLDLQNEYLKSLKNCLHITYEDFYSNIGIKKLEEYLNFKSKTLPDTRTKLRNNKNSLI